MAQVANALKRVAFMGAGDISNLHFQVWIVYQWLYGLIAWPTTDFDGKTVFMQRPYVLTLLSLTTGLRPFVGRPEPNLSGFGTALDATT